MTNAHIFRDVYVAGMAAAFTARVVFRIRARGGRIVETRSAGLERLLLTLAFAGMVAIPLVYVFSGALGFADYPVPVWAGLAGSVAFLAALWLLWRSHADLGRNWSQTLELREGHELITSGVYRRLRHPMYAAFWLWGIAQPLLLHNWVAGFSCLVSFAPLYFMRVPREERMMLDRFGGEYQAYIERTGRVLPRWSRLAATRTRRSAGDPT